MDVGGPRGAAATSGCGHGHAGVAVRSQDELLAAALPWLRTGVADGDLTVLSCDEATADLLRDQLGPVWLARKLWDHVDLLTGPDGLTVRLSTPLR